MTTVSPEATVVLPDNLSELINLAVSDIRSFDRQVFHPTFNVWYVELSQEYCMGCLAGALIYSRLKSVLDFERSDNYTLPEHTDEITRNKLYALNSFRAGMVDDAFFHMYGRHINIAMPDLRFLENPPNQGAFLTWDEMDVFLEWADQSADIIARYEPKR